MNTQNKIEKIFKRIDIFKPYISQLSTNPQLTELKLDELKEQIIEILKDHSSQHNFPQILCDSKTDFFETCACNPKNGGSGVCGCTLGTKVIYQI